MKSDIKRICKDNKKVLLNFSKWAISRKFGVDKNFKFKNKLKTASTQIIIKMIPLILINYNTNRPFKIIR